MKLPTPEELLRTFIHSLAHRAAWMLREPWAWYLLAVFLVLGWWQGL